MLKKIIFPCAICIFFTIVISQPIDLPDRIEIPLVSTEYLTPVNLEIISVNYKGKQGIRLAKNPEYKQGETIALVNDIEFENGIIEIELAGEPEFSTNPQMREFVGIAFRLQTTEPLSYECFYLRPKNGRANKQIQRNHSTQYISHPEFPWYRLRQENPGVYESYVDLQPGVWTSVKIEVSGNSARLYVHNAKQPCLIVNDLKHGISQGKIALWIHPSTVAHFRNLVVTPR